MNNLLLITLFFVICTSANFQSKTLQLKSHKNLSTFYFDDQHTKISILSKSPTFFFLNLATSENIHYSISQTQNFGKIIKRNGHIHDENSIIVVNDTNNFTTYFNIYIKSTRKRNKEISSNMISSISFITVDSDDLCQKGIEFIQSEKEYEMKKDTNKCFFVPPIYGNSSILYTHNKTYKSSFTSTDTIIKRKSKNELLKNKKNIENPNLLSVQDSENNKNRKTLEPIKNNYPCQYRKKYIKQKKSFLSIIISNGFLITIIVSTILLVFLCTSKAAVDADYNNNSPTTPINDPSKNIYNNYNPQPAPAPSFNPMLPMNQIRPTNTVNSYMNPYANSTLYTNNTTSNGVNYVYNDNFPLVDVIPPSNMPLNNTPSSYPGVVPYGGAMPMPNTMQNSINQVNAYFQPS